ncbi:hypothetical protein G6F61_014460 [Rhizopus arrhizus]|nr:hypothetical protein G6F61_014460 [Rhizopus arrhizus]
MRLAPAGTPCARANATLSTSIVPTITPMADIIATSDCIGGMRSTEASRPACLTWTAGAVARCKTNAVTPTASSKAAASGAAWGNKATLSPTQMGGPTKQLSSSATDSSA